MGLVDGDVDLDLLIANVHPDDLIEKIYDNVTYREPLLLFHNNGKGDLTNISRESGPLFSRAMSGRGLALGDFDNDGAVDVLISNNNAAPLLLKNNAGRGSHWLGLSLTGKTCNRDAIGARITWQAGDLKRHTMKIGGGSYLSSHDPRIVLGIGERSKIDWLEVKWPNASTLVQRWSDLPINRYVSLTEGEEKWLA